jgi:bifunctional NMN adenylyltransferase/nudix hydrolase
MTNQSTAWNDRAINYHVDLSVVIGRFQGPHNGHKTLFDAARKAAPHNLCLVGSSFIARDTRNPFTFGERREMLEASVAKGFAISPIVDDLYNDQVWVGSVQTQIDRALEEKGLNPKTTRVGIVGHHKDATSYYLDMFKGKNYTNIEVPSEIDVDATSIREWLFNDKTISCDVLPDTVLHYLLDWSKNKHEIYKNLRGEYKFMEEYKKQFAGLKYPPKFVCVDAAVICHGHILLIKRRSFPGKGLWALPGGHLNDNETIMQGIIRELIEETKIKIDPTFLLASMKGFPRVFDAPRRSLRGRTISHAGLFVLNTESLPKVKGDDDAERARWFKFSEFYDMSEKMFEDHYSMVNYMIGRAG